MLNTNKYIFTYRKKFSKKNIYYTKPNIRNGFTMLMAIAVVVIIAGIMTIVLSITSQGTKRTTDIYLYEQAVLYSKSAAEKALLDISAQDYCVEPDAALLNYTLGNIYNINVTLRYIYTDFATCAAATGTAYTTVITPEQNGSVLMDIAVTVDNQTITSEPIRYFRRYIQKL